MASKPTSRQASASHPAVPDDLLERCRVGNPEAQRELYERCKDRVYGLMVRMVGRDDAADVSQQTFIQLFRKLKQFSGQAQFETWLYRLATNEALQHLRKRRRHHSKLETLVEEPASPANPLQHRGEQRELLEMALQRLDEELRSIFILKESEGLSYREIAEVVDIPEGTVGSRLNRARRELQTHLIDLGWEP